MITFFFLSFLLKQECAIMDHVCQNAIKARKNINSRMNLQCIITLITTLHILSRERNPYFQQASIEAAKLLSKDPDSY